MDWTCPDLPQGEVNPRPTNREVTLNLDRPQRLRSAAMAYLALLEHQVDVCVYSIRSISWGFQPVNPEDIQA